MYSDAADQACFQGLSFWIKQGVNFTHMIAHKIRRMRRSRSDFGSHYGHFSRLWMIFIFIWRGGEGCACTQQAFGMPSKDAAPFPCLDPLTLQHPLYMERPRNDTSQASSGFQQEPGKSHQAVLVLTRCTSGCRGGCSKEPSSATEKTVGLPEGQIQSKIRNAV